MTLPELLTLLPGHRGRNGQYTAHCPAHDDQDPSLSVSEGDDGRILINCHKGCSTENVLAALGLEMSDLFPAREPTAKNKPNEITATYPYFDPAGQLIAEKVRSIKYPKGIWRRPDGKGGWIYNRQGVPHALYVAGSLASNSILIAEGEKDCNSLHALGFDAVSGMDGAGPSKWKPEYTKQLEGKNVCIFADNDDIGKDYALETAKALHGNVASLQVFDLQTVWPEIPDKGDISDLIEHFGTESALNIIASLIADTPQWEPQKVDDSTSIKKPAHIIKPISAPDLLAADFAPAQFLVDDILPTGLTIFSAPPKIGKSWMALDLGICLASGKPFLQHQTHQCGVLYLAFEDEESRLQSRLKTNLQGEPAPPLLQTYTEIVRLDGGLIETLEYYLYQYPTTKLIIIDTLQTIRGLALARETAYQQDYRELGTLKAFADHHNIAILGIHHNRKQTDEDDPFNMISGSVGIMGASDTCWVLTKDKRNDTDAVMHITGRDVSQEDFVIRFDPRRGKWNSMGNTASVVATSLKQQHDNNPIVQTIRKLLNESENHRWDGTATELLRTGLSACGVHLAPTAQKLSRDLKDLNGPLHDYDGIIHVTTPHGNAGSIHHFYYSVPDWVAEASEQQDILPL